MESGEIGVFGVGVIDLDTSHPVAWVPKINTYEDVDVHVDKAKPFIEAGKPVLIDKPMVGNLRDIHRLIGL